MRRLRDEDGEKRARLILFVSFHSPKRLAGNIEGDGDVGGRRGDLEEAEEGL